MAMQFNETTQVLTDSDVWMDVGRVAGGYLAPYFVDTATGTMLPSEAFGIGGMALGEMVVDNRAFTLGSGAFVVCEAALEHTLIESPTTADLLLWEDGTVVQPDAVDYDADSFDYAASETETDLTVFYIARNPASVGIRKTAPVRAGRSIRRSRRPRRRSSTLATRRSRRFGSGSIGRRCSRTCRGSSNSSWWSTHRTRSRSRLPSEPTRRLERVETMENLRYPRLSITVS